MLYEVITVADVMEIAKKCSCMRNTLVWDKEKKLQIVDCTQMASRFLVRIKSDMEEVALVRLVENNVGDVQWIKRLSNTETNEFVFITAQEIEAKITKLLTELENNHLKVLSKIRVL